MQEYIASAIVLSRTPSSNSDSIFTLYTKELGKVRAKARSVRKITSKLAAHLTVSTLATVRLVGGNSGFQIVDALKEKTVQYPPPTLSLLAELLPEQDANTQLWSLLANTSPLSWKEVLTLIGWDPTHANCASCGKSNPRFFLVRQTCFLCTQCVRRHHIDPSNTYDAIHLQKTKVEVS